MTLYQAINMVDDIKPNAFSDETKTAWLNECEGMVQTEVLLLSPADIIVYRYDRDHDAELLAKAPHDKIYWMYLAAMVDFGNGEYNKYANTMQLFNAAFAEYQSWYALHYRPADGEAEELGYYISAYAIAVKHGYSGTEEEWLESLRGRDGTVGFEALTPEQKEELRGEKGAAGKAASIGIGTITTGLAGSSADVTNSGSETDAILNFVIPRGDRGAAGAAAKVRIGTVTTGEPGTAAQVTNSGSETDAVLDFTIPRGATGASGSGTGDMLAATYDPAGGARQVAFKNDLTSHTGNTGIHVTAEEKKAWSGKLGSGDLKASIDSSSGTADCPSAKAVYDFVTAQIGNAIGGTY